jgi:hypothetical protein
LQDHLEALPPGARGRVEGVLRELSAWEPLQADGRILSHLHDDLEPPFARGSGRPAGRFTGTTAWNRR